MRKTLLTIIAVLATVTGFAQDNLAQGKDAIATTGNAAAAVDGNTGTRWESAQEDNQTWQVDLGTAQEFNTIQIVWEGAYTKTYTIEAGDNVDGDGWLTNGTVIASGVNNAMPNTQTIKLTTPVTARYIKYNAIDRGTQWGNSFWEFRVFNAEDPVLTSIDLSASAAYAGIGSGVTLTAAGKDQLGSPFETGTVTYTVEPTDAGTVSGNIYTPTQAGSATITASVGDIQSNAVTVTAYDGEKIDLFTDWATRVEALGEDTKEDSKVGAFDANINSLWELYGASEERNYETGFIVDLLANYDITAISVMFEGACSRDYQISFAGSNKEFGAPAFTWAGPEGVKARTDFWTEDVATNSTKGVRYVKFLSTRAATQYGVKIFDFSVYGKSTDMDATVPTISDISAEATGDNSIAVNATATDASEGTIDYTFTVGSQEYTASAASGEEVTITIADLKPGKEYTITVVATNAVGVKSEPATVTAITTGEPDPNLWAGAEINQSVFFSPNWKESDKYNTEITENGASITTEVATPVIADGIWQAQFAIITDIATTKDNSYDFHATFTADKDVNASIKLYQRPEEGGSNDVFYFSKDIQLKAGEPFTLPNSEDFINMPGLDLQNISLLVAFGGNPAATITISDIEFKVNDGDRPELPETYDYDDDCNLFKTATIKPVFYYAHTWDWIEYDTKPVATVDNGTISYTLPEATDAQWQAQAQIKTDIETFSANHYDFSVTIIADKNVNAVMKLYKSKDDGGNDGVFYFTDEFALKANSPKVIIHENMKGISLDKLCLLIDTGGNPANTSIVISEPVLKESDCGKPTAITSVKANGTSTDSATYNLAGQRVNNSYRGIVIQNGKKVIR